MSIPVNLYPISIAATTGGRSLANGTYYMFLVLLDANTRAVLGRTQEFVVVVTDANPAVAVNDLNGNNLTDENAIWRIYYGPLPLSESLFNEWVCPVVGFGGLALNYGGTGGQDALILNEFAYFSNLVTSQYQISTNHLAWLKCKQMFWQNIRDCGELFLTAFDINGNTVRDQQMIVQAASGVQLDILGNMIGASRTVPFTPSGGVSPILDDTTYRLLLKATIAKNQWDGLYNSIQAIWLGLFPDGTISILDNQNMTATVLVVGSFTSIVQDLITNGLIVPRPETVQYTYTFPTFPLFGFDRNDAVIAGYDTGHFI